MAPDLRGAFARMLDEEVAQARVHAGEVIHVARQRGLPVASGTVEAQVAGLADLPCRRRGLTT